MAKGVSIGIAADGKEFDRGVKTGVLEPLEDAAKALKDLAHDGDKSGRALEDAMRDQQAETNDLAGEYRKLGDEIKDSGKRGGQAIALDLKAGTDAAGEGMEDLKGEARQSAAETAASFDGSAESIVGMFQEVAANAFAGFGPAGAIAGIAAAAGIGLVTSALDAAGASTEEVQARTADLAQEYIETGGIAQGSIQGIADRLKDLATESDPAKDNLAKLFDISKRSGSSFRDLAQAYAGNVDGLKDLWREGEKRRKQLEDEAKAVDINAAGGLKRAAALQDQADAQKEYVGYVGQSIGIAKEAAKADELYAKAGGPELEEKAALAEKASAAIEAAAEADAQHAEDYAHSIQGALTDAGAAWQEYTDDGKVNLEDYNTALEKQFTAVKDYQKNMVTASKTLNSEALSYIQSLGADAAPLLQAYVDAPLAEKKRTAANWSTLGTAAGTAYTEQLEKNIPETTRGPRVMIGVDRTGYDDFLRDLDKGATLNIYTNLPRTGRPIP